MSINPSRIQPSAQEDEPTKIQSRTGRSYRTGFRASWMRSFRRPTGTSGSVESIKNVPSFPESVENLQEVMFIRRRLGPVAPEKGTPAGHAFLPYITRIYLHKYQQVNFALTPHTSTNEKLTSFMLFLSSVKESAICLYNTCTTWCGVLLEKSLIKAEKSSSIFTSVHFKGL